MSGVLEGYSGEVAILVFGLIDFIGPPQQAKGEYAVKEIASYKILEKLGQSLHAEVFKVIDPDDPDHLLVLKRVRPEFNSEGLFFFLFQQVERLRHVHIPGVICPTLCEKKGATIFLIRDYLDNIDIGAWQRAKTSVPLPLFFKLACSLADLLQKLHKKDVIHRGIKPANILIDPATLDLFLIDLVRIPDVDDIQRFMNDTRYSSAFSYISPEQTGRGNHPVGQNTDLYSLGVLFYELLTRNAPFLSDDPLALIHSHLAEDPYPLHQLDPEIPEMISGIIAKLMQKQPADRYQTCGGLIDDLKKSQDLYLEKGEVAVFEPGLTDSRSHSPVPPIGGGHESSILIKGQIKIRSGEPRAVWISGPPGIGKTASLLRDARSNFHAGKRAMEALAFDEANRYFNEGMKLLPEGCWDTEYAFTFSLFKNLAGNEMALGNQERSYDILSVLIERSKNDLDRVESISELVPVLLSQGRLDDAVKMGNRALACFDRQIPDDLGEVEKKLGEFLKIIEEQEIDIAGMVQRPIAQERAVVLESTLYNQMMLCFIAAGRHTSMALCGLQGVSLFGNTKGVHHMFIFPIVAYCIYLLRRDMRQEAQRIASALDHLFDRFPDSSGALRGMSWMIFAYRFMTTDLSKLEDQLWDITGRSKDRGGIMEAAFGYCLLLYVQLFQGKDLSLIERTVHSALEYCWKHGLSLFFDFLRGLIDGWVVPMGRRSTLSDATRNVLGPPRDEAHGMLNSYSLVRVRVFYCLGDYERADMEFRHANLHSGNSSGSLVDLQWWIIFILNSLRLVKKEKDETRKQDILAEIGPYVAKIEAWSHLENPLKPYIALIRAEQMGVSGEFRETRTLYLDAIDVAHEKGYALLEGQSHELLGELLSTRGHAQAGYHLREAANLFYGCRADVKLASLKATHPTCFTAEDNAPDLPPPNNRLDVEYLMRAAGAISRELDPEALLKTFMIFLMERLGAQNGYGLLEKDGEFFLRVQGTKTKAVQVATKAPFPNIERMSRGIIRHVRRTEKTVVLDNALEEGPFMTDTDVRQQKLRSILCIPVMKQQELMAILYLENRLMQGVFTKANIKFATLLAYQAIISLENAMLVDGMKKTEQALTESEEMLDRSRDFGGMVAWERDVAGDAFRYAGDTIPLLGRPVGELATEKDILGTIHPCDMARVAEMNRECICTAGDYDIEFRVIHPDGAVRWLRSQGGAVLNGEGRIVQTSGMFMDITDRKESELALRSAHDELERKVEERTRQLKGTNRELEAFNYTISHDLRAPLRHIGVFSDILQEDFGPDMNDEANRYVTKIRTAAKRLDALITALLRLSRISNKELICREINMNGLAKQIIESFKAENPGRGVKIILGDLAAARGEPALIRNALSNLLENAFKYTRLQKETRIEVGCKREGNGPPVYFVSDNGVGFDMKYKGKLFGIFQRLHSEKDFEGIGVGLAGAKRIINKHGGRIWAEAEPDKGAIFYFTLYEEESN